MTTNVVTPSVPPASEDEHRPRLFEARRAGELAYGVRADDGPAVIVPLPLGVTLDGLESGGAQRAFLEFVSAGTFLIALDQRGSGRSRGSLEHAGSETLGRDVWAVADAAGVERAILYGVFDGGLSVIEAARLAPERVLGLVLNFVPPAFGARPGASEADLARWFPKPEGDVDTGRLLEDLGVQAADADALTAAWVASGQPHTALERLRLLREIDVRSLRDCAAPGLIIEPQRRSLFNGWGAALAAGYPDSRLVLTGRGAEALGAIEAFIGMCVDQQGRNASRLSDAEARTISEAAAAARDIRVIVVPVDQNPSGARAVDLACRLAEARDASIVLTGVLVVPRTRPLDEPAPEAVARVDEGLRMAEAVAVRRNVTFRSRTYLARGFVDGVVRVAREEHADLVVLPNPQGELVGLGQEALRELFVRTPCEVLIDRGPVA